MSSGDLDHWFTTRILPLEAALMRFLRHYWKDESEVADLRQETYVRVYAAAGKRVPQHPKAFTFMIARNLAIDKLRRSRVVPIELVADYDSLAHALSEPSAEDELSSRQEVGSLERALGLLPDRCREVLIMRKIHGYSQRATAEALGITESTVERHVSKGVRRLADALHGKSATPASDDEAPPSSHAAKESQ